MQAPAPAAHSDRPDSIPAWAAALAIAAAFSSMLAWSWRTWPDPLVDYGTQLYLAWQIAEGKVLYRDLAYFKGPLSQYVNAALFRVFGVALQTLVLFNLALFATVVALIYRLLRQFTDQLSATAATVVAVCVFGFIRLMDIGNYNWVTPYAHEYTHGVALALTMTAALARAARTAAVGWVAVAGVLCGLVFLTTAEVSAATFVAAAVGVFSVVRAKPQAGSVKLVATFIGAALIPPLVGFALLTLAMPASDALRGTLGSWPWLFNREIGALRFYREGMGTHDVGWSASRMLQILGGYAAIFVPPVAVALLMRRRPHPTQQLAAAACAAIVVVVLIRGWGWFPWYEIGRPLPLFVIAMLIACSVRLWRGDIDAALGARLMLTTFGFVLLAKMVLNSRLRHYGFVLALPATVLLVEALVGWLPRVIDRAGGAGVVFRWTALAACATATAAHLYGFHLYGRDKTIVVGRGGDALLSDARGEEVNLVLRAINLHAAPGETLAVFPQGLMINYLARRPHPNAHLNFMPPEVISSGEANIVAGYDRAPPDLVAINEAFTTPEGFLLPEGNYVYGRVMLAWLRRNYEVVDVVRHPRSPSAGWLLLRRRDAASRPIGR